MIQPRSGAIFPDVNIHWCILAFDDRHIEPLIAIALIGIATGAGTPLVQRLFDVSLFIAVPAALFSSIAALATVAGVIWWRER